MKTSAEIRLENLLLLIKEAGGDENLAEKYGCSPPYIKQLKLQSPDSKTGTPKGIGDKSARKLEECTGKPRGWMDAEHLENVSENNQKSQLFAVEKNLENTGSCNTAIAPTITGVVPLISWVQAGAWCQVHDIYQPGDADEFYPTTAKVGSNAYALRVKGDSMEPKFPDGCIIIVDPAKEAVNNSFVVVRESDTSEATFKQLQIDGHRKYLKPINPRYPIMELRAETLICGVVVKMEMDV